MSNMCQRLDPEGHVQQGVSHSAPISMLEHLIFKADFSKKALWMHSKINFLDILQTTMSATKEGNLFWLVVDMVVRREQGETL